MKRMVCLMFLFAGAAQAVPEVAGLLFVPATTNQPRVVLPLEQTEVHIDVTAGLARTEVVQRFTNPLDRPLEAVYIFPLPSDAAIEDFELRLEDRTIRSSVKEREAAKAEYEQAKSEGKRTALLEQERPNLFTTSVANLLPGESVDICFAYVESLRFRTDRYDITFPMVVGTRYIPFTFGENLCPQTSVPDADRLNPPVLHPNLDSGHRVSIEVELHGLPVRHVASSTHALTVRERDHDEFVISPKGGAVIPNCEFSLAVQLRKNESPAVSFVESTDGASYGLLSVFPPIGKERRLKRIPRDVVFLIDTSGSMSGESIAQARSGLKRCLDMLDPSDRFTIVRFASNFSWFSPELRMAAPAKIDAAREYIAGLTADGGTEMQPALEYVLQGMPHETGRMPMVVFLTDGDVGNEDALINLLSRALGNTRLFTFGIGSAPNEFLMHRMAEVGRGQSRFIRSHEDVGEVMADFFQTLDAPVLTDVTVEWETGEVRVYPEQSPDIFYGRPLQLVASAEAGFSGKVRVSGMLEGKREEYVINLDHQSGLQHPAISTLYGRMQIKDLMVQHMQADRPDRREALKQEIITVALKHQLVSRFTSRIAVEEQQVVQAGNLVSVKVPVPAPKGWQLHGTATNEPMQWLAGLVCLLGAWWLRQRRAA